MKKRILLALGLGLSFALGYAFHSLTAKKINATAPLKRATGIGGVFFKCQDPKKIRAWYAENLGLNTNDYGAVFEWRQGADSSKKGFTQWSPFSEKTKYFAPSTKDFMINYRVADLETLLADLKQKGVVVTDSVETAEYGKFVHIMDPEGNKLELWEPKAWARET